MHSETHMKSIKEDIDLLYKVNSADIEALEDAKITLKVIRDTDPGVYDNIIDESLALINKALGMSYSDSIDRVTNAALENEPLPF